MFKTVKENKPQYESNVDWEEYNDHVEEQILAATEESPNQVCFISAIIDSGMQPPDDEYKEYDWEDDERQNKLLKAGFGCYVEDDKFFVPNKSADSIIIYLDFPDIQINYGQFFSEDGEDDWKPYRASFYGSWQGKDGVINLTPQNGEFGPKTVIHKLAKATGLHKKGPLKVDTFDIGKLLGKVLTMDVEVNRGGENGEYLNDKVKNPSAKHPSIPVPEHNIEPFLIPMNWTDKKYAPKPEHLQQLRPSTKRRLEMSEEWEDSSLKAQLELLAESKSKDEGSKDGKTPDGSDKKHSGKPSPKKQKVTQKVEEREDDTEFDDDIPF